jgi:antitoxin component of RelBE/YafQ-DinJ toxin-antitoxin module
MQTKLTLRMDDELIKKAKQWAETRGISLSELVAQFFDQLPNTHKLVELSPWTRKLVGVLKEDGVDDGVLRKQYLDYLKEKYQ